MGDVTKPRKAFLVEKFDERMPLKALAEPCENPHRASTPEIRAVYEESGTLHGIKLTLPDESVWWVDEETWLTIGNDVRQAREFAAAEQAMPPTDERVTCWVVGSGGLWLSLPPAEYAPRAARGEVYGVGAEAVVYDGTAPCEEHVMGPGKP